MASTDEAFQHCLSAIYARKEAEDKLEKLGIPIRDENGDFKSLGEIFDLTWKALYPEEIDSK